MMLYSQSIVRGLSLVALISMHKHHVLANDNFSLEDNGLMPRVLEENEYKMQFKKCEPWFVDPDIFINCTFSNGGHEGAHVLSVGEIIYDECDNWPMVEGNARAAEASAVGGTETNKRKMIVTMNISHIVGSAEDKACVEGQPAKQHNRTFCARGDLYVDPNQLPGISGDITHYPPAVAESTLVFMWPCATLDPTAKDPEEETVDDDAVLKEAAEAEAAAAAAAAAEAAAAAAAAAAGKTLPPTRKPTSAPTAAKVCQVGQICATAGGGLALGSDDPEKQVVLAATSTTSGEGGDGEDVTQGFTFTDSASTVRFDVLLNAVRCDKDGSNVDEPEDLAVGESLYLCIDVDQANLNEMIISSIDLMEIKKDNVIVTSPIKEGKPNFVTVIDCNNQRCLIGTLMVPGLFDKNVAQTTIVLGGVAGITYLEDSQERRLIGQRKAQQEGLGAFIMPLKIGANDLPGVTGYAQAQELRSSASTLMAVSYSFVASMLILGGSMFM